jgi:catechol 2,3-dioxygenase-like lactoylglutathione lyase family enzyme
LEVWWNLLNAEVVLLYFVYVTKPNWFNSNYLVSIQFRKHSEHLITTIMLLNPIILFTLSALPAIFACNLHNAVYKRDSNSSSPHPNNTSTYPKFIPGADGPADSATLGYTLNHHALLVSNLTQTREFYGDVLGMRHLFTFEVNPHSSLMFMGHAQGGKNGTGFQDADTMFMERRNREGLMEFLSYAVGFPEYIPYYFPTKSRRFSRALHHQRRPDRTHRSRISASLSQISKPRRLAWKPKVLIL